MSRMDPREKKQLAQFSIKPAIMAFLEDCIKRGERTAYIEALIEASPEYKRWKANQ